MNQKFSTIKVLEEFDWIKQRSNIYLGSTEEITHEFYFAESGKFQTSSYLPALQKLFDEVIENSVDEFTRTKGQYANKVDITVEKNGTVTICDNGRGLEIEKHHQFTDIYVPEVIFTKLRSGSNFEDIRNGIGVNGLGAVLTVLFSNSFKVTTYSHSRKYTQSFDNMLSDISVPKITAISPDKHGTEITFTPNFEFFKTTNWNTELLRKKIVDLSFNFPGIKFTFNGDKVISRSYKDLVSKYATEYMIEERPSVKLIVCGSEGEFKHHSLVNGANTFLGGTHIDYISSEIVNNIRPALEKKYKLSLKPSDIKNHISIFCQLQLPNPIFTSQTKEQIINKVDEVKPLFIDILNDKFYKKLLKNELLVLSIIAEAQMKQEIKEKLDIKAKQKNIVKKKVAKLVDANSKFRDECMLFLTEGDSALGSCCVVRDPKTQAFLPLKGKILNVHDRTSSDVLGNEELQDILNTIGLRIGEHYYSESTFEVELNDGSKYHVKEYDELLIGDKWVSVADLKS